MARAPFHINGTEIPAGTRATVDLPAAQLYTHTPLTIPVQVIHGRQAGPVLLVCAAIHGDEINGVEIIRRLVKQAGLRRLSGTLIAVPIVNVLGFIDRTRYLPDRRDLNRSFPGSESGSLAARVAHLFKTALLDKSTHVIDLHTAAIHRANLPQIRANLADPVTRRMAEAFGVPLVINAGFIEGSLRHTAHARGIPVITYESGEALRFDEPGIRAGLKGVLRVMRDLAMLPPSRARRPAPRPQYAADSSTWLRAEQDGIFRATVGLGARVKKGQALGWISDPFGEKEQPCEASISGIVIGRNNLPLVHEGEALFHIARFDELSRAAEHVERWAEGLEADEPGPAAEPPIV
ncbi:succinylglutamate desuccinylase/aspartoacylase family protein [Alkalilimnicola sp. S0819]|uniref:succinylglutamate desuccinylase/aspartoacylase family protein n=1 Tax=Alkalilimnicola sp. S0819 TaxID=2613922 RepID=UPI0012628455|nr:succinylglutamate desuccinylase/aspartoacylase family protein [Alkalilimnicola sp. S0819]KAB7624288.1 succinylglutamate desuccinylase [Alkalilimnicola sp. S0819]MPQ16112.1 succinylglutamate desuccinylase [Alkalilimnicola sp. S0819]